MSGEGFPLLEDVMEERREARRARSAAQPRCEAAVGYRVDESGIQPVGCHQWRGLRVVLDSQGREHRYCVAPGHRVEVMGKARRA